MDSDAPRRCKVDNIISLISTHAPIPASRRKPIQLAFQFDSPHLLLLVVTEHLHGATFSRHLQHSKPRIILDARVAPHFNFTAVGGTAIKNQIEAVGATYVRHSVPFHEFGNGLLRHDPASIATALSYKALESSDPQWPLMIMLKDRSVANAFSPFLIGALSRYVGGEWAAELVR